MDDIIKPTPEEIKSITENTAIQEAAKKFAEELKQNEDKTEKFNAFLTTTKDRLDLHFDHIGYVCFVFDKKNIDNKFMSVISNTTTGWYLNKLRPFLAKHRQTLNKASRILENKLRRV